MAYKVKMPKELKKKVVSPKQVDFEGKVVGDGEQCVFCGEQVTRIQASTTRVWYDEVICGECQVKLMELLARLVLRTR